MVGVNASGDSQGMTLTQAVRAAHALLPPTDLAIEIKDLNFDFGGPPILTDVNLELRRGTRTLLVGANGAGKSTLLRLMAGKSMVKSGMRVFSKNPFFESCRGVTYLGTEWALNPVVRRDIGVSRLLKSLGAERNPERCQRLMEILDIDSNWHMHEVSDGQRRRVQIALGLLEPWDLLLLDEVTVDLDVLVRQDLLDFLVEETETRGATIVYATHIFDGLGGWPTHVAHIADGRMDKVRNVYGAGGFPELEAERRLLGTSSGGRKGVDNSPLLRVVERWLREDLAARKAREVAACEQRGERVRSRYDVLQENMAKLAK